MFIFKNANLQYNGVFVGYAYRDHWIWNNNYHNGYSIILWKDYNGATPVSISVTEAQFSAGYNALPSYAAEYLNLDNVVFYNDPWGAGNYIIGTDGGLNFGTHDTYDNDDSSDDSSSDDSSDEEEILCIRDPYHICDNGRGRRYGNYQNLYGSAFSGVVFQAHSKEFYAKFYTVSSPSNTGVYAYGITTDQDGN